MKKRRCVVFLSVFLAVLQLSGVLMVQAELVPAQTEIRVGLTSLYSGKETLKINNSKLGYGYCTGTTYLQEAVLESSSGFVFTPVNGYFVCESKTYASYQAALQAALRYREQGVDAYPGSSFQCNWHVYFGNSVKYSEAEWLLKQTQVATGKDVFEILPGNNYRIMLEGSFGSLLIDVDNQFAYPQFRPLDAYAKGVRCIDMGTRAYRGRMEIGRYGGTTLTAVNVVKMTEYLYGVVPSEMPSTWHEEALKAQAVCARSYALVKAGYGGASNAKKGYKIVDTVSSQVYKGYLAESIRANKAVDATDGEMVCYNNKVVATYFFSTSGGQTENAKDVWGVEFPYLQRVTDAYEHNGQREVWSVSMNLQQISDLLAGRGVSIGTVSNLVPAKYTSGGRVYALNVTGDKRSMTLQGTTIRTLLNLYSTKFKIVRQGDIPDEVFVEGEESLGRGRISQMYIASADGVEKASETMSQYVVQSAETLWNYPRMAPEAADEVLFAGMGYGHGVGMSQYGAKGMAEAGYTYKEIIEYYFTGAYVK